MKKSHIFYLLIIQVILFSGITEAQNGPNYFIDFRIQDPLPDNVLQTLALSANEDFSDSEIAILNPVADMTLQPAGAEVKLQISVAWRKNAGEEFLQIYNAVTFPFTIEERTYTINYLVDVLEMEYDDFNDDNFSDIRERGKLTGEVIVVMNLLDKAGSVVASDQQELSFLNPSQSLDLLLPSPGGSEYIGGILASWTELQGVDRYVIKASYRDDGSESLEEALDSGNPILDNVEVTTNTVNLINLESSRQWIAGKEVVLQVSGLSNGELLQSEIVNFYLKGELTGEGSTGDDILNLAAVLGDQLNNDMLDALLSNANLEITGITVDGQTVSYEELQAILNELQNDPDRIIRIELINQ